MITLLASMVGFLSSIFPEFVKFWKDKNDKQHELEKLAKQIEISKMDINHRLDQLNYQNEATESATLYSTFQSGIDWVDALNGTVRPVMAYSFFALYVMVKWMQYDTIQAQNAPLIEYLNIIWNTDDQAIFASIISFYFGQRTFSKMWRAEKK